MSGEAPGFERYDLAGVMILSQEHPHEIRRRSPGPVLAGRFGTYNASRSAFVLLPVEISSNRSGWPESRNVFTKSASFVTTTRPSRNATAFTSGGTD